MQRVDRFAIPTLTIARYVVKGYIKERIFLVALIFAFALMVASYLLSPLAVGAQGKVITDIGLAAISILGITLVVLLGASSFSRERSGGILASILAKPVSRIEFIMGKYVGTIVSVSAVMLIMACVFMLVMVTSNTPIHGMIFTSVYLSVLEMGMVTALMTLFSSFTSPMLCAFFTVCIFVCGHLSKNLLEFAEVFGGAGFKLVAQIGYYVLPNFSFLNVRTEAVHALPLPDGYVLSVSIYALFYTLVVLFLGGVIFRSRDIE
ncbi:MAG: ABC transporter permease subunit [bacterium]|nr:ABC transporter permease subunit [bacterium]